MHGVFITGASSGLGAALALQYARQGASLGLLARRGDALQQLIASLPHPERHRAYAVDVCDHAALKQAADDFLQYAGRIDAVIASAGVSYGTLTEHAETSTPSRASSPSTSRPRSPPSPLSSPR